MNGAFKYVMTERDYVSFNLRLCLRRGVPVVAASLGLAALFVVERDREFDLVALLSLGALGAIACATVFVLTWRNARRIYRETPSMRQQRSISFDADGFEITQASGDFRSPWTEINRWTENSHAMVLWINQAMMILIPKDSTTTKDIEAMATNLANSGLPAGKKRKQTN